MDKTDITTQLKRMAQVEECVPKANVYLKASSIIEQLKLHNMMMLNECKSRLEDIKCQMEDHQGSRDSRDGTWQTLTNEHQRLLLLIEVVENPDST